MKPQPQGNGSGKINVVQQDMGGWARVYTDSIPAVTDNLGMFLSHTLSEWFRHRPQFTMQCAVPIVRDGFTVELHAWYTLHTFPDRSGQRAEEQRPRTSEPA